jgi:hypothetical protein
MEGYYGVGGLVIAIAFFVIGYFVGRKHPKVYDEVKTKL